MPKATNNNASRKRNKDTIWTTPSVCHLDESYNGHRQSSLLNFFGNPVKKLSAPPRSPSLKKPFCGSQQSNAKSAPKLVVKEMSTLSSSCNHTLCKSTKSTRNHGLPKKTEQLYLDFGQASFGKRTECAHCGTLYVNGVVEDRIAHERVCRDFKDGVSLRISTSLRTSKDVVMIESDTFLIEVKPSSKSLSLRRKAQEVRKIAEQELGFVALLDSTDCGISACGPSLRFKYFLYVAHQRIVGLLVTEKITQAFVATGTGSIVRSGKARNASLGVHLLWVHKNHRGNGIATRLLDFARERSVYGYTSIPMEQVAFSSPTEAGLGFARSYVRNSKRQEVLVYQFAAEDL